LKGKDMEQLEFFDKMEETNPICPICGNIFEKTRSNRIYCSVRCSKKIFRENVKKIKVKIFKSCKNCGNSFEKKKSIKTYPKKYKDK
jgi:endogenous inhibitor of DNA gyrase (YacG/DUF329 family)